MKNCTSDVADADADRSPPAAVSPAETSSFLWRLVFQPLWLAGSSSVKWTGMCGINEVITDCGSSRSSVNNQLAVHDLEDECHSAWERARSRFIARRKQSSTCNISPNGHPTGLSNVQQRERWDCGLACLQMIIHWIRDKHVEGVDENCNGSSDVYAWLLQRAGTQSIWTVDLVRLLYDWLRENSEKERPTLSADFMYITKCLSVNPDWNQLEYYRDAFAKDEHRIHDLISQLQRLNLPLYEISYVSIQAIVDLVQREDTVAIVLVDNFILKNHQDEVVTEHEYSGHYIVLAGVSTSTDNSRASFFYYDPALDTAEVLTLPVKRLECAWRARGTDNDILFVAR